MSIAPTDTEVTVKYTIFVTEGHGGGLPKKPREEERRGKKDGVSSSDRGVGKFMDPIQRLGSCHGLSSKQVR